MSLFETFLGVFRRRHRRHRRHCCRRHRRHRHRRRRRRRRNSEFSQLSVRHVSRLEEVRLSDLAPHWRNIFFSCEKVATSEHRRRRR